jgi:adenylate cyclase
VLIIKPVIACLRGFPVAAEASNQFPLCSRTNPIPTKECVRQELEKILTSRQFVNSPILQNFLRFIVKKTLAGESIGIKAYSVATEVLGREADFDPNLDPAVRILAGRLRRALAQYYQEQGKSTKVFIDVPRGAYVPRFRSVSQTEDVALGNPGVHQEPILALPSGPSVAVMPFLNLTGDQRQGFFADGLAEEITNELARYQDLRVIAFQSTLRWKGRNFDAREVGRDLKVRFFLEGSIRKEARLIKFTVRLVDTLNGLQVWGGQYQRQLKPASLIALQEEIARNVAGKIGDGYGIIPLNLSQESRKKPPESLDTYEAILRCYHHFTDLTPETFEEALRALEQTVTREPGCGLAWSLLAFLYFNNYMLQFSPLETPVEKTQVFVTKGVALDSQNQVVRASMTFLQFCLNERGLFLLEVERALALNPNSPFITGYLGWLLALYGEWDRGLAILGKGMELNPHCPGWFHMAPYFYFYHQSKYTEALQQAQQFQMPQFFWDPLLRAAALGQLGRNQEAAQALTQLLAVKPDFPSQARFLIGCYAKSPYLVEGLLEGLRLAGLKI